MDLCHAVVYVYVRVYIVYLSFFYTIYENVLYLYVEVNFYVSVLFMPIYLVCSFCPSFFFHRDHLAQSNFSNARKFAVSHKLSVSNEWCQTQTGSVRKGEL
jgi:hypothetical protein